MKVTRASLSPKLEGLYVHAEYQPPLQALESAAIVERMRQGHRSGCRRASSSISFFMRSFCSWISWIWLSTSGPGSILRRTTFAGLPATTVLALTSYNNIVNINVGRRDDRRAYLCHNRSGSDYSAVSNLPERHDNHIATNETIVSDLDRTSDKRALTTLPLRRINRHRHAVELDIRISHASCI
jgi:hypothetical protein